MIYISNNTNLQTIDTFDLPLVHSLDYVINVSTSEDNQITYLNVTHDGVTTGELQESVVQSNGTSLEFTTDVDLYVGRLRVQPVKANTKFVIEKTVRECNLFSESTVSGKLIYANTGIAVDGESSIPSMTIRQPDYNYYGEYGSYFTGTTLGPEAVKEELLIETWIPINGSDFAIEGNNLIAISSGQNPNFQYQKIEVEPGYAYHFHGHAHMHYADDVVVKEGSQRQQGQCFIKIGKTPGSSEYVNRNLTENEEYIEVAFTPEDTFYVSFGFGDRSNKALLNHASVKQIAPFQSWNKDGGSFYVKWPALANGSSLIDFGPINISIDSSNNVTLNDEIIGAQEATNRLCVSYDETEIRSSLNGDAAESNDPVNTDYVYEVDFVSPSLKFSYFPTVLSNTELIEVSSSG